MSTLSVRSGQSPSDAAVRVSRRSRRTNRIVTDLGVKSLDEAGRRDLTTRLIETNAAMARAVASRYRNRGIELEDLEQVALLALTKAAQRFDPGAGHDFHAYAVPTIRGELRRHFRDAGWMVRPPRRVQNLQPDISRAQEELQARLGRSPRPTEVAAHLGIDLEDVVEALTANGCFHPASLDSPVGEDGFNVLGDLLPRDGDDFESAEARVLLSPVLQRLPERDLLILRLRFAEQRTQQEIGDVVGLTQAQVSRSLTSILRRLRADLGEASGVEPAPPAEGDRAGDARHDLRSENGRSQWLDAWPNRVCGPAGDARESR